MPQNEDNRRLQDAMAQDVLLVMNGPEQAAVLDWVTHAGYRGVVRRPSEALAAVESGAASVAILDMPPAQAGGLDLFLNFKAMQPGVLCIMTASAETVTAAMQALQQGAYACLRKPLLREELVATLGHCFETLQLRQEVARRRRVEEECSRLAAAVDQASELIFITDTEGVIQYVNPSFEKITGYTRKEVVGQKPSLLKSGRHDTVFYRGLWTTISGGAVWTGRLVNRKKDGTLYEEEAAITPIRDHAGRIVSYVAVKRDVTREVRLQKQLRQAQKMEAIGTLAGGIAHDFNNILAAIIGYTELARMDLVENAPLMDNINKVLVASYRARDLVAQILAFSRQSEQELKPVSISSIVKEVLKLLRASLPATIDIRQRVLLEPATILADATQIHQVMMNICANAGHAMRSTGGVLDVYLGAPRGEFEPPLPLQHLAGEDYLCLAIRDTGHGMPSEILDRIFDPYFTTKKKEEGTGLGLAVVHGIVTSHNGHLTVESKPGEGTTFKIYFPLVPVKVFDRKKSLGVKLPGGSERVFLIDDEIDIVQVNRQMLERLGYQVAAYVDSRTALADFDAAPEKVDLLITDLTMPGLTGDQVVRAVHARRPELPIIMCTGFS